MCRIAAYRGPPITLGTFLTQPAHSLARQSWDAREMASATVNADGWGAGWYADDGHPAIYRHTLPIWADGNVDALSRSLSSPMWLANVRSATSGLGTDHANTQPFAGDGLMFLHNGFIADFARSVRVAMRRRIHPHIEAHIQGNTDSEYLFALLRSQTGSLQERLSATLDIVGELLSAIEDSKALLNMIVTDGQDIAYVRSAFGAESPSLYRNDNWHGGVCIASEAFDDDPSWQPIEPHSPITV